MPEALRKWTGVACLLVTLLGAESRRASGADGAAGEVASASGRWPADPARAAWQVLPAIGGRVQRIEPLALDARDRLWVSCRDGVFYRQGDRWHPWMRVENYEVFGGAGHRYFFDYVGGVMYFWSFHPYRIYRLTGDDKLETVCVVKGPHSASPYPHIRVDARGRVWRIVADRVSVYDPPAPADALKAAGRLVSGLIDDRAEVRQATAEKILALGHHAIKGLELARRPDLPQLNQAIERLSKRMLDPDLMFENGPWKHWPRRREPAGDARRFITDDADNFYLVSTRESLWFRGGELAARFTHEHFSIQNWWFHSLGPGRLLANPCGAVGGQSPAVLDFHARRVLKTIPERVKRAGWIPRSVWSERERLAAWFRLSGNPNVTAGDQWSVQEIAARLVIPPGHTDQYTRRRPVASARPGEVVRAHSPGRMEVFRDGKVWSVDWRNGVYPIGGTVFADSKGTYWIAGRRHAARYWPGPPGGSPVPSGPPDERFEVVPLGAPQVARSPRGEMYLFREQDGGELSRWSAGRWETATRGLRWSPAGPPAHVSWFAVDDLGRVHVKAWRDHRPSFVRVAGDKIESFKDLRAMLADSYAGGPRWFAESAARRDLTMLADGLWMISRSHLILHYDGTRWRQVYRDIDVGGGRLLDGDWLELFLLPDGRLAAYAGARGANRLDIIDRKSHVAASVQVRKGVSLSRPSGLCPMWPADAPVPDKSLVFHRAGAGITCVYGAAEFDPANPRGWDECLYRGLPARAVDFPLQWRHASPTRNVAWAPDGSPGRIDGNRWACGFVIPLDLSRTPAAGFSDKLIVQGPRGELWIIATRSRVAGPVSYPTTHQLVRWKPTPIQAHVAWKPGRVCRLAATTTAGRPVETLGYLWQVDDQPWRLWLANRPLDLAFLQKGAKTFRVVAVSGDGRGLSPPAEAAIPASAPARTPPECRPHCRGGNGRSTPSRTAPACGCDSADRARRSDDAGE